VGTWEFVYYKLMPNFSEKYAAHMVEHAKASGATQQKVDETERQAEQFKQMYTNPAINIAMIQSAWSSPWSRRGSFERRSPFPKIRRAPRFAAGIIRVQGPAALAGHSETRSLRTQFVDCESRQGPTPSSHLRGLTAFCAYRTAISATGVSNPFSFPA
jgi:hypothetical protein